MRPTPRFLPWACLAAAIPACALAAPGDLDCGFGSAGIVTRDFSSGDAPFNAIDGAKEAVLQSSGKLVAIGNSGGNVRLSRFLADGSLDTTFATDGTVVHGFAGVGFASVVAIDGQDRILVAGHIDNPDQDAFVARFTAEGAIDPTFGGGDGWTSFDFSAGTTGTGNEAVLAMTVDASDRPVLAGHVDDNGNVIHPSNANVVAARLTEAGALDASFGSGGVAIASTPTGFNDESLRAVRIDPAGRIVAVGNTYYPQPTNHNATNTLVVRWTAAGALDTSFAGTGVLVLDLSQEGSWDGGVDMAFGGDGKLLVLGTSVTDDPTIARLNDDGTLDTGFGGGDGIVRRSFLGGQDVTERILVQADGKLLVTGWPVVGNTFHFASMRFQSNGTLDESWGGDGVVTTTLRFIDRAYTALLQSDQKLLIVGGLDNDVWFGMARYLNDGHDAQLGTTLAIASATPDPSIAGEPVDVQWTLTTAGGIANGNVIVGDGVDSCTASAAAGGCSLVLTTTGPRTVVAEYAGSTCHLPSTSAGVAHEVLAAPVLHTVTPVAGSGGNIAPSTPQSVADGATVQFTVAALAGYRLVSVSGCGGSFAAGVYTTGPVGADCSVSAVFDQNPVASAGVLAVLEDTPAAGTLAGVDDDPLQFTLVDAPTLGSVVLHDAATGAYTYTPAADANGADSFTFRVDDGDVDSAPATVSVSIAAVNDAPAASFGSVPAHPAASTGSRSVPGFAQFDAGPADEDGRQLAEYLVVAIDDPDGVLVSGSVAIDASGTLGYALAGIGGSATVTARARDGGGTANGGVDASMPADFALVVAPGADVQVAKDNGSDGVVPGVATVYAIVVANAGPNAVTGATLADPLPAGLLDGSWACIQEASSAACPTPAAGTGNLSVVVDLPVDGYLRFDVMATVSGEAGGFVSNTATASVPDGVTALETADDSATDTDAILPFGVFRDGFEPEAMAPAVDGAAAALG